MMMDTTEFIGYVAMAILVVSFIPKEMRRIRLINLVACVIFVIYGIMLGLKWPIIISNGMVSIIQIYHLFLVKSKINIVD